MHTVTQQQKKGQNIWQHPFEAKKKHYFQQMQVACGFDTNIYLTLYDSCKISLKRLKKAYPK